MCKVNCRDAINASRWRHLSGTLLFRGLRLESSPAIWQPCGMPFDSGASLLPETPQFRTTHWSVVLQAGQENDLGQRQRALELLCQAYWYPIYAFVRRRGHPVHDAQDLTQSFFEQLLERKTLAVADRERGRFRTFLLAALNNFLINEARDARRLKRGGGAEIMSLDVELAEQRLSVEPATTATPERVYEQQWVSVMLQRVLNQLQAEAALEGNAERFEQLQIYLVADRSTISFQDMAAKLGVTEAAVKGVVRRLRSRYRELLRTEVAQTIGNSSDVEDEIRYLMSIF